MTRLDAFLWVTPLWEIGAAYLALLACAGVLGVWLGGRARVSRGMQVGAELNTVLAAILGLLGLLLAFTYAQAAARFEHRRQLLVSEANAIATVWLRTSFLEDPPRAEMRDLLTRYVTLRLASGAPRLDLSALQASVAASEGLHQRMWSLSTTFPPEHKPDPLDALLVGALNEMIDLHTARVAAYQDRLPGVVLALLAFVSTLALLLVGYSFGAAGQRSLSPIIALAIAVALVSYSILDLDRAHRGQIRLNQGPLQDVLEMMQSRR